MKQITRNTRFEDLPENLTVEEFREFMGLGRNTAYELVKTGEVPSKSFGRRKFIPREAVRIDPEAA